MEYLKAILVAGNLLLSIILGYIANFFAPILPFLIIVVALVFADLYTGIKAAKIEGNYEALKASEGFRKTVNKISQYFIAILLSQGMVLAFDIPTSYMPLTYIVALYISIVEFKSNLENIARTTGTDIWQVIRSKIDNFLSLSKKSVVVKTETTTKKEDIK